MPTKINTRFLSAAALLVVLGTGDACAQAPAQDTKLTAVESAAPQSPLDASKGKFNQAGVALDAEATAQRDYLRTVYGKSLDKLVGELQGEGNLDGLLVVKQEKERFLREKTVPEQAPSSAPSGLVILLQRYASAVQKAEADITRKQMQLTDQYAGQLRALVKKLTVEGKIGDAMIVNEEAKRMTALVEELKVRANLAAPAPGQPGAATARATTPMTRPGSPRESVLTTTMRGYRGGEAVKVDLGGGHQVRADAKGGGGGFLFDGRTSYLKVDGNIPQKIADRDFTLVFEFRPEEQPDATAYILEHHRGFPWTGLFVAIENNKTLRFRLKDLPHCDISCDIAKLVDDGNYHHVALTRQGKTLEASIDGKQVESAAKPERVDLDIDYGGNPLMIGVHCEKQGAWYRGGLRNMAFFIGEPLGDREIQQLAR